MKTETKQQPLLVQVFPHDSEPNKKVLSVFLDTDRNVFFESFAFEFQSTADPCKLDFAAIENALEQKGIVASITEQSDSFYYGTWTQRKDEK